MSAGEKKPIDNKDTVVVEKENHSEGVNGLSRGKEIDCNAKTVKNEHHLTTESAQYSDVSILKNIPIIRKNNSIW